MSFRSRFPRTFPTASIALRTGGALFMVTNSLYSFNSTSGESMLPTVNVNYDCVHVNKLYKYGRGIEVGDVVVAAKPTEQFHFVCKRVTGLEGDVILVDPSRVENYLTEDNRLVKKTEGGTGRELSPLDTYIVVPKGHCFLTGDNLSFSLDSRNYSVVPLALIRGKIFAISTIDVSSLSKLWQCVKNGFYTRSAESFLQDVTQDVRETS